MRLRRCADVTASGRSRRPRRALVAARVVAAALVLAVGGTVAGAVPPTGTQPSSAHTIMCKSKHGAAKRKCVRRAARHRRRHRARRCRLHPAWCARPPADAAPGGSPAVPQATPAPPAAPAATEPPAGPITAWRPPGSRPLPDDEAARRVQPAPENRPDNAEENRYRPAAAEIDAFRHGQRDPYGRTAVQYNPLAAFVTGGFAGTTDEILQWSAHKWGVPEDVLRAVAVNEAGWHMNQLGNRTRVPNPGSYPALSRIPGTSDVYQSLGITQIRWTPEGLHPGTEPLRWKSTAFNADYWGAVVRYYFDGLCGWCGAAYGAGQGWASIGAWYSPSPWNDAATYVAHVRAHMELRTWAQPGF